MISNWLSKSLGKEKMQGQELESTRLPKAWEG